MIQARKSSNTKDSVGRRMSTQQPAGAPPGQEWVSVAVLPPRLPKGMAPPSGVGTADCFAWDESLNWTHNNPISSLEQPRKKSFMGKIGLTPERKKSNNFPPYVMRQVKYDTWRKHYAKDADGNYHGTHAPAEDCLLKPDDVAKWRLEAPKTIGDLYTRGPSALPGYQEVAEDGAVPEYTAHYDGPPVDDLTVGASRTHSTSQVSDTMPKKESIDNGAPGGAIIAEGKTAQQIIEEAKAKHQAEKGNKKESWKKSVKGGMTFALLGAGS